MIGLTLILFYNRSKSNIIALNPEIFSLLKIYRCGFNMCW